MPLPRPDLDHLPNRMRLRPVQPTNKENNMRKNERGRDGGDAVELEMDNKEERTPKTSDVNTSRHKDLSLAATRHERETRKQRASCSGDVSKYPST